MSFLLSYMYILSVCSSHVHAYDQQGGPPQIFLLPLALAQNKNTRAISHVGLVVGHKKFTLGLAGIDAKLGFEPLMKPEALTYVANLSTSRTITAGTMCAFSI